MSVTQIKPQMFHFWSGHTFSLTSCLMLSFYLCLDIPSRFLRSGCSNPVSYATVITHKHSACPTTVIWTIQIMWYFVLRFSSSLSLIMGWNIFLNPFFLLLLTRTLFAVFVYLVRYLSLSGPSSLLYNGYRVFPGGKVRPGRASDHSTPSSPAVMDE